MADGEKPDSALAAVESTASAVPESESSPDTQSAASSDSEALETAPPSTDASPATEGTGDGTAQQGPIPFTRHKSALENARQKAREEAEAQFAWAKGLSQQEVQDALHWRSQYQQDPLAFYKRFGQELEAHPHFGPQLKAPADYTPPKPTLRSEDGQLVYNAEQLQQILDHQAQVMEAKAAEQFQAIQSQVQSLTTAEQQRQQWQQAQSETGSLITRAQQQWPGFKDNQKAIGEYIRTMPNEGLSATQQLYEAYIAVVAKKLSKSGEQAALKSLQSKAAAGSVDPANAGTGDKARPKNAKELEKFIEKRAKAG